MTNSSQHERHHNRPHGDHGAHDWRSCAGPDHQNHLHHVCQCSSMDQTTQYFLPSSPGWSSSRAECSGSSLLYLSQPPPTHNPHQIDHSNLFITRLGFLIDFISVPVIAGFTSAAAITIASSQVLVVMVKVISIKVMLTQMVQTMVKLFIWSHLISRWKGCWGSWLSTRVIFTLGLSTPGSMSSNTFTPTSNHPCTR